MAVSGQKFVGRNRAPRVQIEYDTELYGSEKKDRASFCDGGYVGSFREVG